MTRRKMILGLALAAALLSAPSVQAATVLTLNTPNPGISAAPGPYGTVTINLVDSTHASVTFAANTVGSNHFMFAAQGVAGVNVNASSFTMSGLTGSNSGSGFNSPAFSDGGSANEDGFGSFNQTIDNFDGYQHAVTTLSFSLTNLSGTWADSNSVLTPNSNGSMAAAHVFVTPSANFVDNVNIATGYAANGGNNIAAVPEPATHLIAMSGLLPLGLAFLRRYRRASA